MKPKGSPLQGNLTTEEEAEDLETITFIPSADGLAPERRVTEAGEFVTPALGGETVGQKIIPRLCIGPLPRIPYTLFSQALDLFRYMMKARADGTLPLEALIHIHWDKEDVKSSSSMSPASLWVMRSSFLMGRSRWTATDISTHADPHSHNDMDALFSAV